MASFPLHFLTPKATLKARPDVGVAGVVAVDWILPGELVAAWGGHVITGAHLAQLPTDQHRYVVQIEEDLYLATLGQPESADFINHSCDPNLGLSGATTLVARRVIQPAEELCFDYAMSDGTPFDEFDCRCGSLLCRGRVTGNDWQLPELWHRYDRYFSPYLQRRIARLQHSSANSTRSFFEPWRSPEQ